MEKLKDTLLRGLVAPVPGALGDAFEGAQFLEGGRAYSGLSPKAKKILGESVKNPFVTTEDIIAEMDKAGITTTERDHIAELLVGFAPAAVSGPMALAGAARNAGKFGQAGVVGGRTFLSKGLNLSDETISQLPDKEAALGPDEFWNWSKEQYGYGMFRDAADNIVAEIPDTGAKLDTNSTSTSLSSVLSHPEMDKLTTAYPQLEQLFIFPAKNYGMPANVEGRTYRTQPSETLRSLPFRIDIRAGAANPTSTALHELNHAIAILDESPMPVGATPAIDKAPSAVNDKYLEVIETALGPGHVKATKQRWDEYTASKAKLESLYSEDDIARVREFNKQVLIDAGFDKDIAHFFVGNDLAWSKDKIKNRYGNNLSQILPNAKPQDLDTLALQRMVKETSGGATDLPQVFQRVNLAEKARKEFNQNKQALATQLQQNVIAAQGRYEMEAGEVSSRTVQKRFEEDLYDQPFRRTEETQARRAVQWLDLPPK